VVSRIPDPRNPCGMRYPLAALLTVALCAVLAGVSSFAAITDWLHDLDEPARIRVGFTRGVPAGTTVWRLLTPSRCRPSHRRISRLAASLDTTCGYTTAPIRDGDRHRRQDLTRRSPAPRPSDASVVRARDQHRHVTGIVLTQVTTDTKSNEVAAFTRLLDAVEKVLGSLAGVLFVADAMHTQTGHAQQITTRGACRSAQQGAEWSELVIDAGNCRLAKALVAGPTTGSGLAVTGMQGCYSIKRGEVGGPAPEASRRHLCPQENGFDWPCCVQLNVECRKPSSRQA
jgi:hypothetical protein